MAVVLVRALRGGTGLLPPEAGAANCNGHPRPMVKGSWLEDSLPSRISRLHVYSGKSSLRRTMVLLNHPPINQVFPKVDKVS